MLITRKRTVIFLLLALSMSCILSMAFYGLRDAFHGIWSISIYVGESPFKFSPRPLVQQGPVLTASQVVDVPARFVADPFMVRGQDVWYLFFEVFDGAAKRGVIGLATSKNGMSWQYKQVVLEEPFHLSYPYVFKWKDSYYMIPESHQAGAVRLYKATEFPIKWMFIRKLMDGSFNDPSVVFKDGKWWLFALKGHDCLTLYYAESPFGPWTEHPKSPLLSGNKHISRPGGRLIVFNGKIIRYTQDDDPIYGKAVRAFQVDEITTTTYREHELGLSPILKASGSGWNAIGMHTIDPHQIDDTNWIACVDGKRREGLIEWKLGARLLLFKLKQVISKQLKPF